MFTLYVLFSHTISDFIIQSNEVVKLKADMKLKGYLRHAMALLVTMIPLTVLIKMSSYKVYVSCVIIIILFHTILDIIKEKTQSTLLNNDYLSVGKAIVFVLDQLIHILLIIAITKGISLEYNIVNEWLVVQIFNGIGLTAESFKKLVVIIYISFSGAYLIPLIFDIVYKKIDNYAFIFNDLLKKDVTPEEGKFIDEVKTGKWIGILERILILIFLYSNQISSIGFVIAVKSLARFKMMENKIFSEYYLLGTLFSVVYSFVAYAIFQKVL